MSHTLGLLVAGVMLVSIIGGVVLVSVDKKVPTERASAASAQAASKALADLLVESTGEGWFSVSAACKDFGEDKDLLTPEGVTRFALGAEDCAPFTKRLPGNMSFNKLANLQRAALAADPANGFVDYEEARAAIGFDEVNLDFHIRTEPILASIRELLEKGYRDPNMRPLYIGDYEPADANVYKGLEIEAGVTETGSDATFWVRITNNGVAVTVFETVFTLHLKHASVDLTRHTPSLGINETHNVTVRIPKTSDWSWSDTAVEYMVSDPLRVLATGAIDASALSMTAASASRFFNVHGDKVQYELSTSGVASPKVYYEAFEGDGDSGSYSNWKLEIYDALGLLVASDTNLHTRGWESFNLLLPGVYDVKLKTLTGATLAEDKILVVALSLGGWSKAGTTGIVPQESVFIEAAYISALIENFDPYVFSEAYTHVDLPYQAGGDIYPDIKTVMNNDLRAVLIDDKGTSSPNDDEATLDNYNVMIVGSNVDHQVMTSQAAKGAIRDWVYAGGVLIVMGSHDQAVQWLQPIFHSSIKSASGGISTPDENHPVLKVPNQLDYRSYDSHGLVWEFSRPQDAEHFTHVLLQGDNDLLALSDQGEFGAGRVLLSAYQAFDMFAGPEPGCDLSNLQPTCAGLMLLHNLITQAYHGLFVDYGPPLPTHKAVGVTMRLASLWHPQMQDMVAIRVQVYVF